MIRLLLFRAFFLVLCFLSFLSCSGYKPANFSANGREFGPLAKGREAQAGRLDFSKPKKLEYLFDDTYSFQPNSSLVIEYDFSILPSQTIREQYSLVLNTGSASWELPMDIHGIQYSIPIDDSFDRRFSIALETTGRIKEEEMPVFRINSIGFTERRFGFVEEGDVYFSSSPFVYRNDNGAFVIDVPASFMQGQQFTEVTAFFSGGQAAALEIEGRIIEALPGAGKIYVPPALFSTGQAILSGERIEVFRLEMHQSPLPFPIPIRADPALVIAWPKENWRNNSYEVFHWERFPSLLIFDYADYAVQDRMLKRLAFYVEKAGFRGRLATDAEIGHLHGWNAHDYRAEDLARFFDTARKTNFPLLAEERELERILLAERIIREEQGNVAAGRGAIISISRESPDYLRYRFMAHEGYHGLFFIDEDFRNFSRRRWEQLSTPAKRFITSYFDFQQYDTADEYLLVNEFMAHILQQPVSQAAAYFGHNLPQRLENTWRASALPQKDAASGTWPVLTAAFTAEAEAFSAYVNQRWGLAAGRVWSLRIR